MTGADDMRFKKTPTFEFTDTPRKRAALRRKQRRERDALPLFAEQIAAAQPSEDEEMSRRADLSHAQEIRWRSDRAAKWRKARRMIDSLPAEDRLAIRRIPAGRTTCGLSPPASRCIEEQGPQTGHG
jgi:hypothetical protein